MNSVPARLLKAQMDQMGVTLSDELYQDAAAVQELIRAPWTHLNQYWVRNEAGQTTYLHVLVYQLNPDAEPLEPGMVVDHQDRQRLNCRWDNLRAATRAQNAANRSLSRNNSSGHPGINWSDQRSAWRVRLGGEGGRRKRLDRYIRPKDDSEEARQAALLEAIELRRVESLRRYGEYTPDLEAALEAERQAQAEQRRALLNQYELIVETKTVNPRRWGREGIGDRWKPMVEALWDFYKRCEKRPIPVEDFKAEVGLIATEYVIGIRKQQHEAMRQRIQKRFYQNWVEAVHDGLSDHTLFGRWSAWADHQLYLAEQARLKAQMDEDRLMAESIRLGLMGAAEEARRAPPVKIRNDVVPIIPFCGGDTIDWSLVPPERLEALMQYEPPTYEVEPEPVVSPNVIITEVI